MPAAYDLLAPYYDAVTGDCATEAAFVRRLIEQRNSRAATVLDVACGTGGVTALLAARYRVSGLDISPRMLAVARGKLAPGTPLYLADMTCFSLGSAFDAIVCAYQGVNHLLTFPAWESFFRCVYRHLSEGGVFVFDIVTVGHLMAVASGPKIVQRFGDNYLLIRVRTVDGSDEKVFRWQIEVFELQEDGSYLLLEETILTRSFPLRDIRHALCRAFDDVSSINCHGGPADEDSDDRIWFVCSVHPRRGRQPTASGSSM
jgi:SAM-dependent methyltransferase